MRQNVPPLGKSLTMPTTPFKQLHLMLIVITTLLLGVSMLLMGHHSHIQLTTDFFNISSLFPADTFNTMAGLAFLVAAALATFSLFNPRLTPWLAISLIIISVIPLLTLFSSSMWIDSLGGFPAIGSGQGIIKYMALLSIGLMLLPTQLSVKQQKWLAVFPAVLVLLWIGGMKFTLLEAKGIEPLVQSSPLMSWMYAIWDLQMTSNLIGIYDLVALSLLLLCVRYPTLLIPAIAMSGAVFVVTQTFLLSWDAALSPDTLLTTGGHFLIKDLWYVSNLLWLYQLSKQP